MICVGAYAANVALWYICTETWKAENPVLLVFAAKNGNVYAVRALSELKREQKRAYGGTSQSDEDPGKVRKEPRFKRG